MKKSKKHPHLNPVPEGEADAKRPVRVSAASCLQLNLLVIASFCLLISCETTNYVPVVTEQMVGSTGGRDHRVGFTTLDKGRSLFVHRCIECHTLPPVWHYSAEDWPKIVDSMSHRASLKPAERDAIIAYVLGARSVKD
jgi:hypothetical protein